MSSHQPQALTTNPTDDDIYLQLLQVEQEHTKGRWAVVTFFMGISFAVLGFSFQNRLSVQEALSMRVAALFIYWFALALFWRFATYSEYLGECQKEMERANRTTLNIHKIEAAAKARGWWRSFWHQIPSKWLLLGFGVIYIFGVAALWLFGL